MFFIDAGPAPNEYPIWLFFLIRAKFKPWSEYA